MKTMVWTAWNNGKHHSSGSGYGFKVDSADRDRHFDRRTAEVEIQLPNPSGAFTVYVNIDKDSFWNDCRELISQDIGRWLIASGHAPWPSGQPPKFDVEPSADGTFRVKGLATGV